MRLAVSRPHSRWRNGGRSGGCGGRRSRGWVMTWGGRPAIVAHSQCSMTHHITVHYTHPLHYKQYTAMHSTLYTQDEQIHYYRNESARWGRGGKQVQLYPSDSSMLPTFPHCSLLPSDNCYVSSLTLALTSHFS